LQSSRRSVAVTQIAEPGPPPAGAGCPPRETDSRHQLELCDPTFHLDEPEARTRFLTTHPTQAHDIHQKETTRRKKSQKNQPNTLYPQDP
jgi:hypothetical protein